jgi:hypothetical protein
MTSPPEQVITTFWTYIGGKNTFGQLLEIYQEVGYEMSKTIIDLLAFNF